MDCDVRTIMCQTALLFKLNKRRLRWRFEIWEFIEQSAPCLFLLEKDQTITLSMSEIEEGILIFLLEVSTGNVKILQSFLQYRNYRNDRAIVKETKVFFMRTCCRDE